MSRLVTVFGGSGFVGKHVVRALAKRGWRIRVAARHIDEASDIKPLGDVGQIQFLRCDIRRDGDVEAALKGAHAVVNLVAIAYQSFGQNFADVHIRAAARIASTAHAHGIKAFIQMSALGASESSSAAYGRSKAAGEKAVHAHVPTATLIRPSVIFGQGDGFFNLLAAQAKHFPVLPSIDGGRTRFQPVSASDVAEAIARALDSHAAQGKTYELGGPQTYGFDDLRRFVGDVTYQSRPLVFLPMVAARFIGFLGDIQGAVTPFAPILTTDQLMMLKTDNIVSKGALGLKDLGIIPEAMEGVVPAYLWRDRKGGQFAEA